MDFPLGPWVRLCILCLNLLLSVGCSQVHYADVKKSVFRLTRNAEDPFLSFKYSEWIDSPIRSISKRKVVSRKGVTQGSSVPLESGVDAVQMNNTSLLDDQSPEAKKEDINVNLTTPHTNNSSVSIGIVEHSTPSIKSPIIPTSVFNSTTSAAQDILNKSSTSLPSGTKTVSEIHANDSATVVLTNSSAVVVKKKSKPGVTFDVDDLPRDKNGKIIVPSTEVVSSEPSVDYVVPVVFALLALPFIAILGAFLFKRSRDFWERRHYRRMDFLIEGMYNE